MIQLYLQLIEGEKERQDFEILYKTYRKLMHWIANGILHDEKLAEDAVHEAFLRILKNFNKVKDVLCPETKGFVAIVAKNVALSMEKKKQHVNKRNDICSKPYNKEYPDDELHDYLSNISTGFDETADEFFRKELIKQILSLPEKYKEILLLNGYLGYSIRSISSILNITEAAAYKRLQRARSILYEELKGESFHD